MIPAVLDFLVTLFCEKRRGLAPSLAGGEKKEFFKGLAGVFGDKTFLLATVAFTLATRVVSPPSRALSSANALFIPAFDWGDLNCPGLSVSLSLQLFGCARCASKSLSMPSEVMKLCNESLVFRSLG